jgi:hypothetical protein
MADPLETYPLVLRERRWWTPYGLEVDAETLARLWMSDTQVVFLGPKGGSLAYQVDEEGKEQLRVDFGAWMPVGAVDLAPWQVEVWHLIQEALDCM